MVTPSDWKRRMQQTSERLHKMPDDPVPVPRELLETLAAEDRTVSSWGEFEKWISDFGSSWSFRGHGDASWHLRDLFERETTSENVKISVSDLEFSSREVRTEPDVNEKRLLSEFQFLPDFQLKARELLGSSPEDDDVVEWLALMQHHGAPTRLMDWTHSPKIALYFALQKERDCKNSTIWAIDRGWLVSESRRLLHADPQHPKPSEGQAAFSRYTNRRLTDGGGEAVIVMPDVRTFPRLEAQRGHFLCKLSDHPMPFDVALFRVMVNSPEAESSPVVSKLTLERSHRIDLIEKLRAEGIHNDSLFPGEDFAHPLSADLKKWVRQQLEERNSSVTMLLESSRASGR
jgi:hypothetical protein